MPRIPRFPFVRAVAAVAALCSCVALAGAPQATAASAVRLEVGPATEYTNLVYRSNEVTYLGTLCDTCGEILVHDTLLTNSSPESTPGLFFRLGVGDTASSGRLYYLEPELHMANLLVTGHLNGTARWTAPGGLAWGLDQRLDHSLDRRFGLSRRYDSEMLTGSVGYHDPDLVWFADLRPRLVLERVGGEATGYLQDANGGRLEFSASRLGEGAGVLGLDAYIGRKSYPDSALRDYREAFAAVHADQPLLSGFRASGDAEYERRTGDHAQERHDLFRRWRTVGELSYLDLLWTAHARAEADVSTYANPDSIFYSSRIYRAELGLGRTLGRSLDLEVRPRGEWLHAPALPGEEYRQVSVQLDASRLRGGLIDLAFEAGRRQYTSPSPAVSSDTTFTSAVHTDYHFYSVTLLVSQPLGDRITLRSTLDYTAEVHDTPADNNHIVYFSAEMGYGFWLRRR